MRLILIDHARQARAGSGRARTLGLPLHDEIAWVDATSDEMLELDIALNELEAVAERKVRILELRYFLGCTNEEAAQVSGRFAPPPSIATWSSPKRGCTGGWGAARGETLRA